MIENLPKRLVLLAALLGGLPVGLAAQAGTTQDNTPYGTTSAEFLLLGAGARGAALGSAYASIANDVSALYYNPAGTALMTRRPCRGLTDRHLRLQGPAGLHYRATGWYRVGVLG